MALASQLLLAQNTTTIASGVAYRKEQEKKEAIELEKLQKEIEYKLFYPDTPYRIDSITSPKSSSTKSYLPHHKRGGSKFI